ncbi:MAG: polyphosphate polymerase domain-containing protein [Bacteroidaceae bacterium]
MTLDQQIYALLQEMPPITLDEMSGIRLMKRTDTKFLANKALLLQVLSLAKDDYYVQEIQHKRIARYRTTYWDTDDYKFFRMHQAGRRPRTKVRVRTYEDSDGLTFLEVKKKDNHGKTKKKRTEVMSQSEVFESGGDEFVTKQVRQSLNDFHPCLQNYFKRITLVNKGKTERLTIDFDIDYINFDTHNNSNSDQLVIIELKRDGRVFSPIKDILLKLRIKPHGYSKYVIGSYMTNPHLKANLLKQKMREIIKVNNRQPMQLETTTAAAR